MPEVLARHPSIADQQRVVDPRAAFPFLVTTASEINPAIVQAFVSGWLVVGDSILWTERNQGVNDGVGSGVINLPGTQGAVGVEILALRDDDVTVAEIHLAPSASSGLSSMSSDTVTGEAIAVSFAGTASADSTNSADAPVINPDPSHVARVSRRINVGIGYDVAAGAHVKVAVIVNGLVQGAPHEFEIDNTSGAVAAAGTHPMLFDFRDTDESVAPKTAVGFTAAFRVTALAGDSTITLTDWEAQAEATPVSELYTGTSGGAHLHVQGTAATEWTINHSLGELPGVLVVDDVGRRVHVAVEYVSATQVVVRAGKAFAGQAFLRPVAEAFHDQTVAADTWTYNHSQAGYPRVHVVDSSGFLMPLAEVEYVSTSQIVVRHATTETGKVGLVGGTATVDAHPTALSTWTVNHGLGTFPAVALLDPSGFEFHSAVSYPTTDRTDIEHGEPIAGDAYLYE